MAKSITFTHEGKEYTLEFNRKSIQSMERQGFVASDIGDKPALTLPALFAGAFQMHHKHLNKSIIDDMFDHIKNKEAFIETLAEMYSEPILSLIEEPEENEGNIDWEASW